MTKKLVLASTSPYRAKLLSQLHLSFDQVDPLYQERNDRKESPPNLAFRLSREKAISAAKAHDLGPEALIIGSDQVAHLDDQIFSKPGSYQKAEKQLMASSGKWVRFSTGLCITDYTGKVLAESIDNYDIQYRSLSPTSIKNYLEAEKPYDCAGSIKAEGLGITLLCGARGRDINTLYGLPLMLLCELLLDLDYDVISNIN